MKVRFCEHNKGSGKVYKRLKADFPELSVKRKDCIKKCGPCHKAPFATVEGKSVCAIDAEDLYAKVVRELESRNSGEVDSL